MAGSSTVLPLDAQMCVETWPEVNSVQRCLANIYIEGCPETKIKAYVVIDDQSNRSLTKSKLLDLLKLEGEPASYTLKTCSGTSQAKGRLAQGLLIESLERWRVRQRKT